MPGRSSFGVRLRSNRIMCVPSNQGILKHDLQRFERANKPINIPVGTRERKFGHGAHIIYDCPLMPALSRRALLTGVSSLRGATSDRAWLRVHRTAMACRVEVVVV